MSKNASPRPGLYLRFDGSDDYVEIPSITDYSVDTNGALSVAVWMRPDALNFPKSEGTGYVHWMGKGEGAGATGQQEWVFRLYNRDHTQENRPRPNHISFYVFNPEGGLGVGSYFQDPVVQHEWLHVVSVADGARTYIYKNGDIRRCDTYNGTSNGTCPIHYQPPPKQDRQLVIDPEAGSSPLRLGTRDFNSYFKGGLTRFRMWSGALTAAEVSGLYINDTAPPDGLMAELLLNANTGSTAADSSQGNDGEIFGATWSAEH
jgi:hypothetical protein